jgi:hypothetical protein
LVKPPETTLVLPELLVCVPIPKRSSSSTVRCLLS